MLKVNVYSVKGTKLADFALPKEYQGEVNLNLLAQAKRVYEDAGHIGLRKTKTRSEVIRTKKKLYKQKGTGGARHGSKNAPIFVGGGIAHGPRPIKKLLTLSKNMKSRALTMAIALKAKEGKMILVDGVGKVGKTKEAAIFLGKVSKDTSAKRFTFASSESNADSLKFFRNLSNAKSMAFRNINAFNVLMGGTLVVDKDVFEKQSKVEKKEVVKAEKKETKKVVKKTVKTAKKTK